MTWRRPSILIQQRTVCAVIAQVQEPLGRRYKYERPATLLYRHFRSLGVRRGSVAASALDFGPDCPQEPHDYPGPFIEGCLALPQHLDAASSTARCSSRYGGCPWPQAGDAVSLRRRPVITPSRQPIPIRTAPTSRRAATRTSRASPSTTGSPTLASSWLTTVPTGATTALLAT